LQLLYLGNLVCVCVCVCVSVCVCKCLCVHVFALFHLKTHAFVELYLHRLGGLKKHAHRKKYKFFPTPNLKNQVCHVIMRMKKIKSSFNMNHIEGPMDSYGPYEHSAHYAAKQFG